MRLVIRKQAACKSTSQDAFPDSVIGNTADSDSAFGGSSPPRENKPVPSYNG